MSLSLYLDEYVPIKVTNGLIDRGVDVLTVQKDEASGQSDHDLLSRACELGRVVYTQDDDFLVIAAEWQRQGQSFSGIIFGPQLALTIGSAINELHLLCEVLTPEEMVNAIVHLPL